jgi:hypothetical protein
MQLIRLPALRRESADRHYVKDLNVTLVVPPPGWRFQLR